MFPRPDRSQLSKSSILPKLATKPISIKIHRLLQKDDCSNFVSSKMKWYHNMAMRPSYMCENE